MVRSGVDGWADELHVECEPDVVADHGHAMAHAVRAAADRRGGAEAVVGGAVHREHRRTVVGGVQHDRMRSALMVRSPAIAYASPDAMIDVDRKVICG